MPETCIVSWQNKILDTWCNLLVIFTKIITMHGHLNITYSETLPDILSIATKLCFEVGFGGKNVWPYYKVSLYGASDFKEYISNLQCELSLHDRRTKQLNEQRNISQNMLKLLSTRRNIMGTGEVRCSQFNAHVPLHRAFHNTSKTEFLRGYSIIRWFWRDNVFGFG